MNYRFNNFELDTQNYQLRQNGVEVEVEPKLFDLLCYLVVNRGNLVTRDELFEKIWSGQVVSDSSLSNQIKAARKAVGDDGQKQSIIKTVHGRGYQFIATTEELQPTYHAVENSELGKLEPSENPATGKNSGITGPSLVVLPFQNLSKEVDNDYFVQGITEGIMTGLCRFREIVVAALGSSKLANSETTDAGEAATRLGMEYALSGSARRSGDRVRITASLIEGQTGH